MQQIRRRQPGQSGADDGDPRLALAIRRSALSRRHIVTVFCSKAQRERLFSGPAKGDQRTDSLFSSSASYA
ncbi:hypothetical protein TgHK011_002357 [Trichoderma gracile]|nr:hypothetical protein TgHK011_002357 [Trichoderma gracile]